MDAIGLDHQPAHERPHDAANARQRRPDRDVVRGALRSGGVDDRHHPHQLEPHRQERIGDRARHQDPGVPRDVVDQRRGGADEVHDAQRLDARAPIDEPSPVDAADERRHRGHRREHAHLRRADVQHVDEQEGIRRGLDPAAEAEQERRDQQPPEGVVVAHGPPRVEQPGRRRLTVRVRLRHVEPALAEARGHPEQSGDGEDPAIVEVLEQLAGGEGQPDAEDGADHAHEPQGAAAHVPRVHALDDGRLRRPRGGAEEVARDHEADERPRRAHERDQQEHAARHHARPHEIRKGRPTAERARPQEREQQAGAARRGHDRQLKRRGAELATQDQADERAREPREDREQQRRGDVDPECSTHFGGETGPDHPDHYLVGRPVAAYPPGRRGCARVVSSPSRAGSRGTPAATVCASTPSRPGRCRPR